MPRGWRYESTRHSLAARGIAMRNLSNDDWRSQSEMMGFHRAEHEFNNAKDPVIRDVKEALAEAASIGLDSKAERTAIIEEMVHDAFERSAYAPSIVHSLKAEFNNFMRKRYGGRGKDWSQDASGSYRTFTESYRNSIGKEFMRLKVQLEDRFT